VRLIRHWYKAGRYSQNELAQHFGVSQATVSNLLRAKVYQRVVS
jgi:predicted XRE-type DNA-binding protein